MSGRHLGISAFPKMPHSLPAFPIAANGLKTHHTLRNTALRLHYTFCQQLSASHLPLGPWFPATRCRDLNSSQLYSIILHLIPLFHMELSKDVGAVRQDTCYFLQLPVIPRRDWGSHKPTKFLLKKLRKSETRSEPSSSTLKTALQITLRENV